MVEAVDQPISTYTDENGNFELNVSNTIAVCNIKISKRGYLTRVIKNVDITKGFQISPVSMWAGDINGDNVINMIDIMEVAKCFNSIAGDSRYIADYDFNIDRAINIADIMITAKHFNSTVY